LRIAIEDNRRQPPAIGRRNLERNSRTRYIKSRREKGYGLGTEGKAPQQLGSLLSALAAAIVVSTAAAFILSVFYLVTFSKQLSPHLFAYYTIGDIINASIQIIYQIAFVLVFIITYVMILYLLAIRGRKRESDGRKQHLSVRILLWTQWTVGVIFLIFLSAYYFVLFLDAPVWNFSGRYFYWGLFFGGVGFISIIGIGAAIISAPFFIWKTRSLFRSVGRIEQFGVTTSMAVLVPTMLFCACLAVQFYGRSWSLNQQFRMIFYGEIFDKCEVDRRIMLASCIFQPLERGIVYWNSTRDRFVLDLNDSDKDIELGRGTWWFGKWKSLPEVKWLYQIVSPAEQLTWIKDRMKEKAEKRCEQMNATLEGFRERWRILGKHSEPELGNILEEQANSYCNVIMGRGFLVPESDDFYP